MRFMFKTDYEDDIKLFPHSGYIVTYGILLAFLAIAPFVLSSYLVSQLVFVFIYATVGVGLMILTGFTGQASLGHAAFLAIGAYTAAYLQQYNVPFPVYFLVAGVLTGVVGAHGRFPGAAAAGHLSRDRDDFLRLHRRGNPGALGKRDPWQRGHAGQDPAIARHRGVARQPVVLLPLPWRAGPDHRRHAQSVALADRPRLRRDPRQRDRGAQHGRQRIALQGQVVCDQRGHHRICRRACSPTSCPSSARKCSRCSSRSSSSS